ncbi:hypothetical protein GLOIN_2v1781928 [Rhizophagus irregularis DAOM 181602=DAOM 197198]|nr:hypothetical protein GLOIN_2v1781928 [Rhizophagus irregularis DAOM 181602=DAOM 197198]
MSAITLCSTINSEENLPITNVQTKIDENQRTNEDYITYAKNPNITKRKGRSPKRLQSNVEKSLIKNKHVLRNSLQINVYNDENAENVEGSSKGCRCERCKQYGHYITTCPSVS